LSAGENGRMWTIIRIQLECSHSMQTRRNISIELSNRPKHNTVASTVYSRYSWSIYTPTKSITFGAKVDGLARKGKGIRSWFPLSFGILEVILANAVRGKNLQGGEWSVQWSSKRSNFDEYPSSRWNGGKKWDFRQLAQDAATFTRK